MNDAQKNTLVRAINHFGVEANIDKALEEMGELTTELSRRRLPRYSRENVIEEISDVLITVEKLRIIFGGKRVDEVVEKKLEGLEKIMNGDLKREKNVMPNETTDHRESGSSARESAKLVEAFAAGIAEVFNDWGSAIAEQQEETDGDWRRKERMIPKGMVERLKEEKSEARKGSLVGECVEAGLMAGLKSIDPDLAEKVAKWAKSAPIVPIVPEDSNHVRPVSEVVGSALLVSMLDSEKTRIPCCAKCAKLGKDLSSNVPLCDLHGIMCGDLTKICCTEYQRKEDGSHE